MKIFNLFRKKEEKKPAKRYYGTVNNNLYNNWGSNTSADEVIKRSIRTLRNRARDLERNNPFVKRYLSILRQNVVGTGFALQNKAKDSNGTLDSIGNDLIEKEWKSWCKKGNCEVTKTLGFTDFCKAVVTTLARDGEVLVRVVRNYKNDHNFALQMLEGDHLDENENDYQDNVIMGIKFNEWGNPVYYNIFKKHPDGLNSINEKIKIKSSDIIHLFTKERPSQSRGVTWLHPVLNSLKMYNAYAEAVLVEKRVTASKMGFYKKPSGEEYIADTDSSGNLISEVQPGMFEILPKGWDIETFDPKSNSEEFNNFGKKILKDIASGLNISYNTLANDLESVNYSSIRAGLLDERDFYKSIQSFLIEHFLKPVFSDWLKIQLLTQKIALPLAKFDKFNAPLFIGRSWSWVDPLKDAKANEAALNNNFKTLTQILNEQGQDLEETLLQRAREKELLKKYGLMQEEMTNEVKTAV